MCIQFLLCSLAWGLRLPFQSKCDKYWTLSVDSLYATCLLDYMDCSYNNTVMSLSLFRSQYLFLVTQIYYLRRVTRRDLALALMPTPFWQFMTLVCMSKILSDYELSHLLLFSAKFWFFRRRCAMSGPQRKVKWAFINSFGVALCFMPVERKGAICGSSLRTPPGPHGCNTCIYPLITSNRELLQSCDLLLTHYEIKLFSWTILVPMMATIWVLSEWQPMCCEIM